VWVEIPVGRDTDGSLSPRLFTLSLNPISGCPEYVLVTITYGKCWIRPCVIAQWFTLFLDPLILGSFEPQSSQPHIPVAKWKDKGKEKEKKKEREIHHTNVATK